MKTTLTGYYFDTTNPEDAKKYEALRRMMKKRGTKCFRTWGRGSHYIATKGATVTLDTGHIFDNQWNTAPIAGISEKGLRVFDWAEDYPINFSKTIKKGHYLEITEEMKEARRNTMHCQYCGKQEPAAKGYVFCPHCIGSEYLKSSDLHLTRMRPVAEGWKREQLTDAERAHLLPLYKAAQTHGHTERDKARIAKARIDIEAKYRKGIRTATEERGGFLWLMDRGIKTDNVIYYNHTEKFSFGWRSPIDGETLSELLDLIAEFPYSYEIKTADKVLEG